MNRITRFMLINVLLVGFIVLVLMSTEAESATRANAEDEDYNTFLDLRDIVNRTRIWTPGVLQGFKWFYNGRSYNSVYPPDYSKDFWMPIEPWEYEVCSRGLTTQLTYEENAGVGSRFSGIYNDTVTVAAYKRVPERNVNLDSSMLYEISWYFHPVDRGRRYSIMMVSSRTGAMKDIQASTGASVKSGAAGYVAFYSATDYDKVILRDESTPQEFTFRIVNTTDANR